MNVSVILYGGGVPLLRSADAAMAAGAAELFVLADPGDPLRRSIADRLRAREVDAAPSGMSADALNAAATSASGDALLFVPAGYELSCDACAVIAEAFRHDPSLALFGGAISVETDDAVHGALWMPRGETVVTLLADPRSMPPVWALRRAAWPGAFDASLDDLAVADLWVRVLAAGCTAHVDRVPIARRPASLPSRWSLSLDSPSYVRAFESLLRKHASLVSCHMQALVIEREIRYARLRDEHTRLLARRDAALAELDALRSQAAHHRAFLAHHGLDRLDWGDLRRPDPVARDWGYQRGGPVDRPFIARFIASHSADVHGAVLEVQENDLTVRFGRARVTRADVVDVDSGNGNATVVADLRDARGIAASTYDCVILTQTAHVIDDVEAVLRECLRILKPGGVLLATFPCASRVCLEYGPRGDFWRMTPAGAETLVRRVFGHDVEVTAFGNVLTQVAFLHGLGATELTERELETADPYNPMLVGVRARRPPSRPPARRRRGGVLLYHRVEQAPPGELDLNVSPDLFRAHLDRLARSHEIIALTDLLSLEPEDLPDRALAITFDDGYEHHVGTVAPLLEARRIPATFFVNSAGLEDGAEHWWDTLERLLSVCPNEAGSGPWLIHDPCVAAATAEERARLIDDFRRRLGDVALPPRRTLTRDGVRALAACRSVTIGAHGVDHLMVTRLSEDGRRREMQACREALEAATGTPVTLFAYPYGAVDVASADTARALFAFAADCSAGAVPASFDVARVPRLDVKAWDAAVLEARIDAWAAEPADRSAISFLP